MLQLFNLRLCRGLDMDNKDYKQVASEIEKNMATMGLDKYDEEEGTT